MVCAALGASACERRPVPLGAPGGTSLENRPGAPRVARQALTLVTEGSAEAGATTPAGGGLQVSQLLVASRVEGREAVDPRTEFPSDVGHVWAWLKISNPSAEARVEVVWHHGGREVARVPLEVGRGPAFRTWARQRIRPGEAGRWRVTVLGDGGAKLAEARFDVAPPPDGASPPLAVLDTEDGPGCRALVNLGRPIGDPATVGSRAPTEAVADIRLESPATLSLAPGTLVVPSGRSLVLLTLPRGSADAAPGPAPALLARRWPDGDPQVWREADPATALEVTSVLGGFVGLRERAVTEAPGAARRYLSVAAPVGRAVHPLDAFTGQAWRDVLLALEGAGGASRDLPVYVDLTASALRLGPEGLELLAHVEGRGEIHAPLREVPEALASSATLDPRGLVGGPEGCGAVGVRGGTVVTRSPEGAEQVLTEAGSGWSLLGVVWIPADHPFSTDGLDAPGPAADP